MFSLRSFNICLGAGRNFRFFLKSSQRTNIFKQRKNFDSLPFSSIVNPQASEYVIANNSGNASDPDCFGSLKHSLEKNKNVKVVRINKKSLKARRKDSREADIFGNLSDKQPIWYPEFDEDLKPDNDQNDDSIMVKNIDKKYRLPEEYLQRMKDFVAEKKIKEALELFVDMKRNRVKPERLHFTYMIGVCGRYGFTEMAFKLLKQITDRGLRPTSATITALFNACGQSPFPEYGLKKALLLREKVQQKNWYLNQITYHAMIKSFGKCGDIQTAFQIVDEMAAAKVKIDVSTYSFLLMSCISNKDAGFTHSVEVWRKMKERKCSPNLYTFNLLLRAVRECDIGPEEVSTLLLQHWSRFSARPYGFKTKQPLIEKKILELPGSGLDVDSETHSAQEIGSEEYTAIPMNNATGEENKGTARSVQKRAGSDVMDINQSTMPSLLNMRPLERHQVFGLSDIKTACDRLMLLGGVEGVLASMKEFNVKPDIKTFSILLQCLPPETEAEEHLMSLLEEYSVRPDTGFFNVLIKRRNIRRDSSGAQEVLMLLNKWSLSPDLITFGVLALGCRNHRQCNIFLDEMEKLGIHPNIEIADTLLTAACNVVDFEYIYDVLMLMDDLNLNVPESGLMKIEKVLENTRKNIIDMEHGKDVYSVYKREGFREKYQKFCKLYENWLKKTKIDKEQHVWDQFRTHIVEKPVVNLHDSEVLD